MPRESEIPETVEVETGPAPGAAVIWLHGLGADGHDFEPIVPELNLGPDRPVRFVFPHAPVRPVTLNGGMAMRAWYDILALGRDAPEDETGIRHSAAIAEALIEREAARDIAHRRIVLAGFSQGGAMALFTGTRSRDRLAGIMGLSCYLPLASRQKSEAHPANAATPVFLAHGTYDPVVPLEMGEASQAFLSEQGYAVDWHTYPMPHAVCAEEIADIRNWLRTVLD